MHFDAMTKTISMSKADANALVAFTSRDKTRATITHILVEPSRGRVTATDGHRLVRFANATGGFEAPAYLVPRDALAAAAKSVGKGSMHLSVGSCVEDALTLEISHGATTTRLTVQSGEGYPNIDSAWKELVGSGDEPVTRIKFNAEYLADLLLVQAASDSDGIIIENNNFECPVVFRCDGGWEGMIMPMRMRDDEKIQKNQAA